MLRSPAPTQSKLFEQVIGAWQALLTHKAPPVQSVDSTHSTQRWVGSSHTRPPVHSPSELQLVWPPLPELPPLPPAALPPELEPPAEVPPEPPAPEPPEAAVPPDPAAPAEPPKPTLSESEPPQAATASAADTGITAAKRRFILAKLPLDRRRGSLPAMRSWFNGFHDRAADGSSRVCRLWKDAAKADARGAIALRAVALLQTLERPGL